MESGAAGWQALHAAKKHGEPEPGHERATRSSRQDGWGDLLRHVCGVMKDNPPHANDYPILERMRRIGIEPGKSFSVASAPKDVQDALNAAPVEALKQIKATWSNSGALANGWRTNLTAIGTYGTDYCIGPALPTRGLVPT